MFDRISTCDAKYSSVSLSIKYLKSFLVQLYLLGQVVRVCAGNMCCFTEPKILINC
jgi:hypothetical protein